MSKLCVFFEILKNNFSPFSMFLFKYLDIFHSKIILLFLMLVFRHFMIILKINVFFGEHLGIFYVKFHNLSLKLNYFASKMKK